MFRQPALRAGPGWLAMRSAWHFLPSSAFAAVARAVRLDRELIGEMHDVATLGISSPVECRPFTNVPSRSMRAGAAAPMRGHDPHVGDHVRRIGDLRRTGTAARSSAHAIRDHVQVRPSMQPSNRASIFACASAAPSSGYWGRRPARGRCTKVRCSTQATSSGCERCSQLRGCVDSLKPDQRAVGLHLRHQRRILGIAAVAPVDARAGAREAATRRRPIGSKHPTCCSSENPVALKSIAGTGPGAANVLAARVSSWGWGSIVFDVAFELVVRQALALQLQAELQDADVGA